MRLVMMGTGPFGVPTFRVLATGPHELLALVTQPPREAPGGREPPPSPMRLAARERGLPILDPASINTPAARQALGELQPDLLVVVDYGQILSPETLAMAPRGGINLHGSLLPGIVGRRPINWALYHGDAQTGVSVIHMTPRVDAGPVLEQAATPIGPDETAAELEVRLAELGAPLVLRAIERLARGDLAGLPQDPRLASPARRLRKTDGEIEWSRSAQAIRNQVRALEPWPRTSTWWQRADGAPLRLILGRVMVAGPDPASPRASAEALPGTVVAADREGVVVATGDAWLVITELQPAGKRMLSVGEFLRGYPLSVGDRLGPG